VTVARVKERPQGPAPADEPHEPVPASRPAAQQHRPRLQLEMSQSEVRTLVGEPVRVEASPLFLFWHYGLDAYVVFAQSTGRVHGWVGVSS
jgi:hypothetical protein